MKKQSPKKKTIANVGDTVVFERKELFILGEVIKVQENTVMVELHEGFAFDLNLSTNLTVVNHKNYELYDGSL